MELRPTRFDKAVPAALGLAFVLIAAGLYWRAFGLFPGLFADEWHYSHYARLAPLADAGIPSYLYFMLYRATSACGDGFLDCARLLNVVFFVGAGPLIYATARRYTGKGTAALVAIASVLAPASLFTLHFMPESMYFFTFWTLSWFTLTQAHRPWPLHAAGSGALLGAASLVKVHALFLLPALVLFAGYSAWQRSLAGCGRGPALGAAMLAALAFFAVKFGFSVAAAGKPGLSLLGSMYGNQAGTTISMADKLAHLMHPALVSARGHLMAITLLAAVPLAMVGSTWLSPSTRRGQPAMLTTLHVYTLLVAGAAIGMTVLYTASLAGLTPQEHLRLHGRYYSFVFPLLLIAGAAALRNNSRPAPAGLALGALLLAVLVIAPFKLPGYARAMTDGPEIAAIDLGSPSGWSLLALALASVLLWAWRQAHGARLYLAVIVPLATLLGLGAMEPLYAWQRDSDAASRGPVAALKLIPASERKEVTVASTHLSWLYRARFHFDHPDVHMMELAEGEALAADRLPYHRKWFLVLGPHATPAGLAPVMSGPDYALFHFAGQHATAGKVKSTDPMPNALLQSAQGVGDPEPWGRWTTGKELVLEFTQPLPRVANFVFTARAFGPNVGQPFVLRVGTATRAFRLQDGLGEVFVQIPTDGQARRAVIEIPQPTAPGPSDTRQLGMGLVALEIGAGK